MVKHGRSPKSPETMVLLSRKCLSEMYSESPFLIREGYFKQSENSKKTQCPEALEDLLNLHLFESVASAHPEFKLIL